MSGPAVLVTGASGTVGRRLAARLEAAGADVRRAGRTGPVRFDWRDPASQEDALAGVERLYVVPPTGEFDPVPAVLAGLRRALEHGVRRIVLQSSSQITAATPGYGELVRATREAPEWAVLRPSWFAQNLTGDGPAAAGLRAGRVVTSTGDGRVPFVDAADIAAVAERALLDERSHDTDHVITGPAALSYADAAALAAALLGHPVEHVDVPRDAFVGLLYEQGLEPGIAGVLADLDQIVRAGAEDRVTDTVARLAGRAPRALAEVLAEELVRA